MKLYLFFVFAGMLALQSHGQDSYDFLTGSWSGPAKYKGADYYAVAEVKMKDGLYCQVKIEASYSEKVRSQFAPMKLKFNLEGVLEKGVLRVQEKGALNRCPMSGEIPVKFTSKGLVIDGDISINQVGCHGGFFFSVSKRQTEADMREVNTRMNAIGSEMEFVDHDKNGSLGYDEPGFVNLRLRNPFPVMLDSVFFTQSGNGVELLPAKQAMVSKLMPGQSTTLHLPIVGNTEREEQIEFRPVMAINNGTVQLNGITFRVNPDKYSGWIESSVGSLVGSWLMGPRLIIEFDSRRHFTIMFDKNTRGKPSVLKQEGKYYYYYDPYQKRETLIFYNITNTGDKMYFDDPVRTMVISSGDYVATPDMFTGNYQDKQRIFHSPSFCRLEQQFYNEELSAKLDRWVTGTWANENGFNQYNFKSSHQIVEYNKVNHSDMGTWFWTYKPERDSVRVFLWLVQGRTFGMKKYEVNLDISEDDILTWKEVGRTKAKYYSIYRRPGMKVPEEIVGVTVDELLFFEIAGDAMGKAFSDGLAWKHLLRDLSGLGDDPRGVRPLTEVLMHLLKN